MARIRDVSIERVDADVRKPDNDRVVVEAPLQIRARGTPVATVMRTPGHDLELVRGLLHAESARDEARTAGARGVDDNRGANDDSRDANGASRLALTQLDDDAVDVD